jgi:hypothetical protein
MGLPGRLLKSHVYEGHGFSRAVNVTRGGAALAAEVRFFTVISVQVQAWKSVPQGLKPSMAKVRWHG